MFEGVTWLQWSTNEQYTVQPGRREIKSDLHVLSTPQQGAERAMPRRAAPSQSWILRVGLCCCWNDILFGLFFLEYCLSNFVYVEVGQCTVREVASDLM